MEARKVAVTPVYQKLDAAYRSGRYNVFVLEGGSRCFYPLQKVCTKNGLVPISRIKAGDMVKSLNSDDTVGYKKVKEVFRFKVDKPMVEITMVNGEKIKCSIDHKFLYNGEYIPIIDILKKYAYEKNTQF